MAGNYIRATVICIGVILGFSGCSGKEPEQATAIVLPSTPILSSQAGWGVTLPPYLRIRDLPAADARVTAHLRKGSVVEIMEKSDSKAIMENQEDYWYRISRHELSGWVFGPHLALYESREKAMNAAGESP